MKNQLAVFFRSRHFGIIGSHNAIFKPIKRKAIEPGRAIELVQ